MSWHLANPLMLLGLLGVAIPVVIHLLSRRRAEVIEWGAMQFLDLGRRARRRIQLTELLLMAGRMLILGLVALALARPFLKPREASAGASGANSREPRDEILILDGSISMTRRSGDETARARALRWAEEHVRDLPAGSSVGVLVAGHRTRPIVDSPSFDLTRVAAALRAIPEIHDNADMATALGEALQRLASGRHRDRAVLVLTDGRKRPWRLDEPGRWSLLRELHGDLARRSGSTPRIGVIDFRPPAAATGADGRVGPIELPRGLVPPLGPVVADATVFNDGPGSLTRTAELLLDGQVVPGSARVVGPIPPGGSTAVRFRTEIEHPGSHALTIRLAPGDDPLAANDAASRPIEVIPALPVLLVDGEPGREPLTSETDFLRAALAPTGDGTPRVAARVIAPSDLDAEALATARVAVLANVDRLSVDQSAAIHQFIGSGGGVLVAPGDHTDRDEFNNRAFGPGRGWMPARLGEFRGDLARRRAEAHPAPATFQGGGLAPFGQGDAPALGEAELFGYLVLEPAAKPPAVVLARLDTGDPWIVAREDGRGRVAVIAGPLDAEGGTLPVNPDFVPLLHELVFHLADASSTAVVRPGEPLSVPVEAERVAEVNAVPVTTPSGQKMEAPLIRRNGLTRAELPAASEPGLYRFDPPGSGGSSYALVTVDGRDADPVPLSDADRRRLAQGWPLAVGADAHRIAGAATAGALGGPRPLWRGLTLAALAGLCLEVLFTRRMARLRGLATIEPEA